MGRLSAARRRGLWVVVLAALAVGIAGGTAWATFVQEPGSPFPVGMNPYGVVATDFNADSRPDVATVNGTSSNVSVLLRQSPGGFAQEAGSPFAAGSGPNFAATADFNQDGRPDIAVANFVSDNVSVLLRQGGGGFAQEAGSPVPAGDGPSSIAAADFNADTRPDLAVPNYLAATVTILLRQAAGGFAAEGGPPATGASPRNLAVADFNTDGRPDLAITNTGAGTVTVLLRNAGSGLFTQEAGSPVLVGTSPSGIVADDFNKDGRPDLAVANFGSDSVTVLLRQAGGGFAPEAGSPIAVGKAPVGIATSDFNRDGMRDLAVTNNAASSVTVLLRSAAGGFVPDTGSPVATATGPYGVAAADFDADGRPDLAISNDASSNLTVLLNTTPAPPPAPPPPPVPAPPPPVTDKLAPRITGLRLTNTRFRVDRRPTAINARAKAGTTIRFGLSEAARVRLSIQRVLPGRRSRGRCVRPTRRLSRAARCTRFATAGTLNRAGRRGTNRVAFSGRIGRRALPPGRYRLALTATDPAGNRSKPARTQITIVRR